MICEHYRSDLLMFRYDSEMDLSIQQLRMFREVSRRGTIAAAADNLGYTPSAVSQQLSAAEKSTGVAMLERVGRNVFLTDAGRELVSHADIVLEQLEEAQAAIERVQGEISGMLRLGFIESVSSPMLGPIIWHLRDTHPELKLRTMGVDSLWPAELIRSGELDLSFVIGSDGSPTQVPEGFDRVVLFRDWFRLAVPSDWLAGKRRPRSVDLATLAGEDFIAPPEGDACGRAVLEAFRAAGLEPEITHSVADFPTALRLVAVGGGVALIPDLGLRSVPDGVEILDLREPRYRTVELVYRSSSAQRPAVRAVLDVIMRVVDELELDRVEAAA